MKELYLHLEQKLGHWPTEQEVEDALAKMIDRAYEEWRDNESN